MYSPISLALSKYERVYSDIKENYFHALLNQRLCARPIKKPFFKAIFKIYLNLPIAIEAIFQHIRTHSRGGGGSFHKNFCTWGLFEGWGLFHDLRLLFIY